MKNRQGYLTIGIMAAAFAVLGIWHLLDVRTGAAVYGEGWLTGWYLALFAVCLVLLTLLGWLFLLRREERKWNLVRIYPIAGLGLGLLYLFVLPPMSAPDEISHYLTAYDLSSRMLGRPARAEDGHVLVRAEDWFLEDAHGSYLVDENGPYLSAVGIDSEDETGVVLFGQKVTQDTYRMIHEILIEGKETPQQREFGKSKAGREMLAVSMHPPVNTTPAAYLPQAVGIAIARLLCLDSLKLAYLGRLCNLLFFVGITWLALKRMPFGREVLFGVAMLPMTLHLSASFSYDVMILAGMFLLTAVCMDLAYRQERVRARDVALLAVIMAACGPCKMIYAPMMGLCLLIPAKKFGGWKRWLAAAAVVAAAFTAAMVLVNGAIILRYATVEAGSALTSDGKAGYSLTLLIHQPRLLLQMFYNTVVHQLDEYHLTMVGAMLGNLDPQMNVPYLVVVFFTLGLLMLALRVPGESMMVTGGRRIWIFAVCAACAAAAMLSMLIACTPQGSLVIEGVQGRYFLPFLPALLLACKNDLLVLTKDRNRSILYLMCCANLYVLIRLYSVACIRI